MHMKMALMWIFHLTVKTDWTTVSTSCVMNHPRKGFFCQTCKNNSTAAMIVAALPSDLSCPSVIRVLSCPADHTIPLKHGRNQSIHNFIFKHKFHVGMAGFLHDKSHLFGDRSCQDAFIVRLHLGDQSAKKVKSNRKTCEDDMSHSASSFLSTIAQLHKNEMEPLQKPDTSTVTTVSTKTHSQSSSARKLPKNSHFQQLDQINSIPAPTFDSLNSCLHSIKVDEDDHAADLAMQEINVAVHALASDKHCHLSRP